MEKLKKEEKINKIAFDLSKKFSYSELRLASEGKNCIRANKVYDYMKKTYKNYRQLIWKKFILDRSCFYSNKRENK